MNNNIISEELLNSEGMTIKEAKDIAKDTDEIIDSYNSTVELLLSKCIEFKNVYEKSVLYNMYDATVLRNRMKKAILEAVNDEI